MSTKLQKRKTKQIRIGEINHRLLKLRSIQGGVTISKLADEILQGVLNKGNVELRSREIITSDGSSSPKNKDERDNILPGF